MTSEPIQNQEHTIKAKSDRSDIGCVLILAGFALVFGLGLVKLGEIIERVIYAITGVHG